MEKCAVILAAGDGKRMKSARPKTMCEVLEEPMLGWVLDSLAEAGFAPEEICAVVGSGAEIVTQYLSSRGITRTFLQSERKGTGHAVMQAMPFIENSENVLVLNGDAPFIGAKTIAGALGLHKKEKNSVTVVSAELENPFGYGRIVKENGAFSAIVEQRDCTKEQAEIHEVNSGAYWFGGAALREALPKLRSNNAGGEYYLTDTVGLIRDNGGMAGVFTAESPDAVLGANSRAELLELNERARIRVIREHLSEGVEIVCADGVIIGKNVKIGRDTKILPGTILRGNTVIGQDCVIGPSCLLENCRVGDGAALNQVQAYSAEIGEGVTAGPFVQLRPGTILHKKVKIGDFVEIKGSEIGEKTSVSHLTYIGDSDVGRGVNFGCGCVTANYDGIKKFRTIIGDNAFIGCNTNLIAPVEIGENAATGAGSTITKNVPANGLAVERTDTKIVEEWEKNKLRPRRFADEGNVK